MTGTAVWALTAVALFLKMLALAGVQARYRLQHKVFVRPDDAAQWGHGAASERELPVVERAQNTLRNDLENIPNFMMLAWAHVALGGDALSTAVYGGVFVASRCLHSFAYIRPRQPLRNRAYLTGLVTTLVLAGHVVVSVVGGAVGLR